MHQVDDDLAVEPAGDLERLLEETLERSGQQLTPRERRSETLVGGALLVVAVLVAVLVPWQRDVGVLAVAGVIVLGAVLSRTEIPVGSGNAVPTMPALVVGAFVAPPALLALLIAAGNAAGALAVVRHPRRVDDRVRLALSGSWYAVGPALVLAAAGAPEATEAGALILLAAFAADVVLDAGSSLVRERIALGIPVGLHARVLVRVWLVDVLLALPTLLVLRAAETDPWAPLLAVPAVVLLIVFARERLAHLRRSHDRLELVHDERARARVDHLTGLGNVRRFEHVLDHWLSRSQVPVALALFDIDDFKRINDTYGHPVGDRVLRAVAGVLRDCCREGDEPARIGGEELAIVAPDTRAAGIWQLADRVRSAVEELEIDAGTGTTLRVTLSGGVSVCGEVRERRALVAEADRALYDAKRAGKNRVRVADRAAPLIT